MWDATRGEGERNVFENLRDQSKSWGLLAAAGACCAAAVLLTLIRWCYSPPAAATPVRGWVVGGRWKFNPPISIACQKSALGRL